METLEVRQLPAASLSPIANQIINSGTGFQLPLSSSNANNQTYSVISDNSQIQTSVSPGKFLTINVTHTSSGSGDISFTGSMTFQLFDNLTPITTSSIEELVNQGYYSGKSFYRIANFFPGPTNWVTQGGSNANVNQPGFPFVNEILPQLTFNGTYQLAMANAGANTNEADFFVTTASPTALDGNYTIFGQLVSGQAIVTDMTQVALGGSSGSTPVNPITINSASLSTGNPDAVININAVNATAGQVDHVTVTATDPTTNTTATQTFTITTSGPLAPVASTGAVRLVGQVLVIDPPVSFHKNPPYNITVDQQNGAIEVTVNGVMDTIQPQASQVQYIVVYGTKGRDVITITPNVQVPATIDGGHGGHNTLSAIGGSTVEHGWFGFTREIGGPFNSLIGRKGRVKFLPQGGETVIFAGVPHVTANKTLAPTGQFYVFKNNKLIPVSASGQSQTTHTTTHHKTKKKSSKTG